MCESTSDCDVANGEICDDGICWGNPPPGTFAAILSPPSSRATLASQEIPQLVINRDGWIDQLQLDKALVYQATLACQAPITCDAAALSATITVTRPSTFPGGPGFRSVVKSDSGKPFSITVPPNEGASLAATYTVTIIPDGRDEMASMTTPAQILPPLRTQLTIEGNSTGKIIELGGLGLPTISGTIKNDAGLPQSNYRVVAVGRWDASAPTEVSTVDFTGTDGTFQIQLSGGLTPGIELVAKPVGSTTRPTLRYVAEVGQTGQQNLLLQWPSGVGNRLDLEVPVKAVEGNGEVRPARGARVIVSSRVPSANGDATYVAEATTDDLGVARLPVLDGTAFRSAYRISVIPQASATSGVMYDQPFSILQPIPEKQLKSRIAIRGVVRIGGANIKDMSVTARPALRFLWSLTPSTQAFLAAIPPATSVTPESGEFVLWVDSALANATGFYDLTFEGASGSNAPTLTIPAIPAPAADGDYVGIYDLPYPAFVRSKIIDDKGANLEGAELKLFRTEDMGALCSEVLYPPLNCRTVATTATLLGRGASDGDGEVRLTLPR
jgi:hypothetical protein